jgi:hypothetical protein
LESMTGWHNFFYNAWFIVSSFLFIFLLSKIWCIHISINLNSQKASLRAKFEIIYIGMRVKRNSLCNILFS